MIIISLAPPWYQLSHATITIARTAHLISIRPDLGWVFLSIYCTVHAGPRLRQLYDCTEIIYQLPLPPPIKQPQPILE